MKTHEISGRFTGLLAVSALSLTWLACSPPSSETPDTDAPDPAHTALFAPLPKEMTSESNPITPEKVALGRMLYYEERLSQDKSISCNSCHDLGAFGVDGKPTSPGFKQQTGNRNSPTVYNAALHIAQFWDGREPDVEAQAKGPILNPIEMAMPSPEVVVETLKAIPEYVQAFESAFPGESDPVTYDNLAKAIGAFERKLVTPSRFDLYLEGKGSALSEAEKKGLETFISVGCATCHMGVGVGGSIYQKMGLVEPYPLEDEGRAAVTGNPSEKYFFKVPSLRNITKTGPYFHDGSIASLDEAIRLMAKHQLGRELAPAEVEAIHAFLESLTGEIPTEFIAKPTLPSSS